MPDDFEREYEQADDRFVREAAREAMRARWGRDVRLDRAGKEDDLRGVDVWVVRGGDAPPLAVDVKAQRCFDRGLLALEIWSVVEDRKPGWTRKEDARTDYVLWVGRVSATPLFLPFRPLRIEFEERLEEWADRYGERFQRTVRPARTWTSSFVLVPAAVVARALEATS